MPLSIQIGLNCTGVQLFDPTGDRVVMKPYYQDGRWHLPFDRWRFASGHQADLRITESKASFCRVAIRAPPEIKIKPIVK